MVLAVAGHMAKVFYRGAYKRPREFNWVIGVVLLLLTLLMSFTGYLLPWDQLAYWAVTVGSEMAAYVPFVGDRSRSCCSAARRRLGNTLLRFYVLHVAVIAGGARVHADDAPVALAQGLHARPSTEERTV
jgi:quinol-cytochrome oxidoreductase complex cytochrome b subunit